MGKVLSPPSPVGSIRRNAKSGFFNNPDKGGLGSVGTGRDLSLHSRSSTEQRHHHSGMFEAGIQGFALAFDFVGFEGRFAVSPFQKVLDSGMRRNDGELLTPHIPAQNTDALGAERKDSLFRERERSGPGERISLQMARKKLILVLLQFF